MLSARLLILALAVFSTFARSAAVEPWFFIQLSDPQLGMFTDNRELAQDAANFEFAVTAVNRLRPAFVVITGDLVNKPGDAAQIAEYRRIVAKIDPAIPVYNVAGNHDIGNEPTPETIAAYTKIFGPDRYVIRHGNLAGLVINSTVVHSPKNSSVQLAEQERWLREELANARAGGAKHIVLFQHHPFFLKTPTEPDQYFNIPLARRATYLALLRETGVRHVFCGHYHRNAEARDGDFESVTSGPVGKPLGDGRSGIRVVIVRDDRLEHRYYDLSLLPPKIEFDPPAAKKK